MENKDCAAPMSSARCHPPAFSDRRGPSIRRHFDGAAPSAGSDRMAERRPPASRTTAARDNVSGPKRSTRIFAKVGRLASNRIAMALLSLSAHRVDDVSGVVRPLRDPSRIDVFTMRVTHGYIPMLHKAVVAGEGDQFASAAPLRSVSQQRLQLLEMRVERVVSALAF